MKKIALDGEFNFTDDQLARLHALGQVDTLAGVSADAEWVKAVEGYDVICSWGDHVIDNANKLKDVLITYPYTELGIFDSEALALNNVYIANARGGNRKSIAEWALFMILALYREFSKFTRTTNQYPITTTESIEGKKVLIVGHGTIGTEIGERCQAFGMDVEYFNRGDDLTAMASQADLVLNALNVNKSSKNLLDADFFAHMKRGSFYVTFTRPYTYDIDGLIAALDNGNIAAAAIDCDPEALFDISNDFYKKCMTNDKILVTPHVAGITKQASTNGREIMVQNIEKFCAGNPQNVLSKA